METPQERRGSLDSDPLPSGLAIGWAEVDITPEALPVNIVGQFHARLSEGVLDPLKATVCILEQGAEYVFFVSCDLVYISTELRATIRAVLADRGVEFDSLKIVFHATHTHTGPQTISGALGENWMADTEIDCGALSAEIYIAFAATRIADGIEAAWRNRVQGGGISFGLDDAVVGHNRRWVNDRGVSTMYALEFPQKEKFRHMEGFEDHSLNLLATYDAEDRLTGLMVNLPCPSQEDETLAMLSADFWHEARQELRLRYGKDLYILPQVSAAGEQTSHVLIEQEAHQRMLTLRGRTAREEVASRIADAVGRILPFIGKAIERTPLLRHRVELLDIPANKLSQADADAAAAAVESARVVFEAEKAKLEADPTLRQQPHWYTGITSAHRHMLWHGDVLTRFARQKKDASYQEELHMIRLGEIAFASNPYEYYLDFGIQIKVRSPALQTFIIQLAGEGTYVPSPRSVMGGGYGSVQASNPVGPEGGQVLADYTVLKLRELWGDDPIISQTTPEA